MSYTPKQGSVAWKVIEFFTTNPEEELTTNDLQGKYDLPAGQFHSSLGPAVLAGILKRSTNGDDEFVYSLGTGHPVVEPCRARNPSLTVNFPEGALAVTSTEADSPKGILALDLSTVQIRNDIPTPGRKQRVSVWKALFERMKVGDSCELAISYRAQLYTAANSSKRQGLGEFTVRTNLMLQTVTVWRVK